MKIRFEPIGLAANLPSGYQRDGFDRDWPVVPRVGDAVELLNEEGERQSGIVRFVGWVDGPGDAPSAVVRFR